MSRWRLALYWMALVPFGLALLVLMLFGEVLFAGRHDK